METIKELQTALDSLQMATIGLFKWMGKTELVIKEDGDLLHTISIGELGGLHENHIPKLKGNYVRFSNNLTLWDLKSNPFVLNDIINNL